MRQRINPQVDGDCIARIEQWILYVSRFVYLPHGKYENANGRKPSYKNKYREIPNKKISNSVTVNGI
ncbi:hypothetical protein K080096A4_19800 [[Clostridium] innocuum]